jgi:hypothetical protein
LPGHNTTPTGSLFHSDISDAQSKRAAAKIRDGELRKAKEILTAPVSFAAPCADTHRGLIDKHPKRLAVNSISAEKLSFTPEKEDLVTVTTGEVWEAIKSAARGSSPGIDGLRFDHLYYMGEGGTHAYLKPLTAFVNLALHGVLPQWFYEFIASADLIALAKSDGGIRPIAMGSIWRKLISKAALIHFKADIQLYFELYQYGVGSRAGCEVVNQRARELLKSNPLMCCSRRTSATLLTPCIGCRSCARCENICRVYTPSSAQCTRHAPACGRELMRAINELQCRVKKVFNKVTRWAPFSSASPPASLCCLKGSSGQLKLCFPDLFEMMRDNEGEVFLPSEERINLPSFRLFQK